jgi:hypothetical protein
MTSSCQPRTGALLVLACQAARKEMSTPLVQGKSQLDPQIINSLKRYIRRKEGRKEDGARMISKLGLQNMDITFDQ